MSVNDKKHFNDRLKREMKQSERMWMMLFLGLSLMMILMTACSSSREINEGCENFQPIHPSHDDVLTDETKRQILRDDLIYQQICAQ